MGDALVDAGLPRVGELPDLLALERGLDDLAAVDVAEVEELFSTLSARRAGDSDRRGRRTRTGRGRRTRRSCRGQCVSAWRAGSRGPGRRRIPPREVSPCSRWGLSTWRRLR